MAVSPPAGLVNGGAITDITAMSRRPAPRQTFETAVAEAKAIGASADEVRRIYRIIEDHRSDFPAGVRSFEVTFERDWTGDPVVSIGFSVTEDNNPSKEKIVALNDFARCLQSDLLKGNPSYWPRVRFRTVA